MKDVSPNTLTPGQEAGKDRVQIELADLHDALHAKLGRAPSTGEMMVENMRRNTGSHFTAFRKEVDNELLRRQVAEQDAKLASFWNEANPTAARVAHFHSIYPLSLAERIRAEQQQRRAERMAKDRA